MGANPWATLARLISGAQVIHRGEIDWERQSIFFANHGSNLDFLAIWGVLPQSMRARTRPVAAADYWLRNPVKKLLADRVFKAVLIDRTANDPLRAGEQMLGALDGGSSLIIFPEGTRNLDGGIGALKSGIFHLARQRPAAQLVPVYLENLNRILPKGEVLPVPLLCSISFGTPIQLAEGEDKAYFLERAREAIVSMSKQR